ncbi:hypothetical protein Riv7116_4796 [Rivularia sp. PCC 7116]|nr:hypothetical protein Riv7116_4796 [Rivularia sp. PCC 7116]
MIHIKGLLKIIFEANLIKKMKIQSLHLEYFKKFRKLNLDFTDSETGLAKDLIVILSMNGFAKTSILQAIAATLGTATGRLHQISEVLYYLCLMLLATSVYNQKLAKVIFYLLMKNNLMVVEVGVI